MGVFQCLWVICSLLTLIHGAPKPQEEVQESGNTDPPDVEESSISSTQQPEVPPELPENWDQTREDVSTLFLNRNDKNELPYPMALADDSYDGQPIRNDAHIPQQKVSPGSLDHIIMRSELYGEPPSMNRDNLRKKRANISFLRSDLGTMHSRVSKMAPRYSTINRRKRDSSQRDSDIRQLLSLWEAEQRQSNEESPLYFPPEQYSRQDEYDVRDDLTDRWLDEPVFAPLHFSHAPVGSHVPIRPKISHYDYSHSFPAAISPEPDYFQNINAIRKKRQWSGLKTKKFMVAKKRSVPNYFRPREDMYFLNDLLASADLDSNDVYPIKRRMIL